MLNNYIFLRLNYIFDPPKMNDGILIWKKFDYKLGCSSFFFLNFKIATYFENYCWIACSLYFYAHVKFCANRILFTIWSINLFLCIILDYKSLQYKQLIDDIAINYWSSRNFACMENIRRKCNLMVDLLKFTSNKKILNKVVSLDYNKIFSQTFPFWFPSYVYIYLIIP